ncbi:hypothetical protein [Paenimyroides ceti]
MTHKIIIFVLMILLYSCKKDKEDIDKNLKITSENPQPPYNQLKYKIILPDTLKVNKCYEAVITFESDFDTIIDPIQVSKALNDTTKTRLITFYNFFPVKSPMESQGNLIIKDSTFVLNKKFVIENILFKETGEFVFCGLIFDQIMYNHYNKKGVRDSVYFDRKRQQIFKKVVVID